VFLNIVAVLLLAVTISVGDAVEIAVAVVGFVYNKLYM
jgi:hypothetical protein